MSSVRQAPNRSQKLVFSAWLLSFLTVFLSVLAWGQSYNWQFLPLQPYQIFPLLGLIAFGLMWAHYMVGTLIDLSNATASKFKSYFRYTGYAVLACLLLHPGILIYQRYVDGFGFPPKSYTSYVAPGLGWITILGAICLLIFLAYELHRVFENRSWWHFVTEAGDLAMLGILYHGFKLGGQLQMNGWFREVWLLYAVTLVLVIGRNYKNRYFKPARA